MARIKVFEWGHECFVIAVGIEKGFRLDNILSQSLGIQIKDGVIVAIRFHIALKLFL
jgi:hypothetical protein